MQPSGLISITGQFSYEFLISNEDDTQVQHETKSQFQFPRLLSTPEDLKECTELETSPVNWTVVTGFILGAVALLFVPFVWRASPRRRDDRIMTWVFVMASFGYGFGISIARLLRESGAMGPAFNLRLGLGFLALHSMILNYVGIRSTTGKLCARDMWAVVHVLNVILAIGLGSYVSSIITFPIAVYVMFIFLYQGIRKDTKVLLKFLGQALVVASFIFQLSLSGKCDPYVAAAVENCLSECFLPQPLAFQYRAVQNIIVTIGIIFSGIGEVMVPASTFYIPMSSDNQRNPSGRIRTRAIPRTPTSLRANNADAAAAASTSTENLNLTSNLNEEAGERRALSVVDEEMGDDSSEEDKKLTLLKKDAKGSHNGDVNLDEEATNTES